MHTIFIVIFIYVEKRIHDEDAAKCVTEFFLFSIFIYCIQSFVFFLFLLLLYLPFLFQNIKQKKNNKRKTKHNCIENNIYSFNIPRKQNF